MTEEILKKISHIIAQKGSCIVAIDGCCGSGKTTLCNTLARNFSGRAVHMDDFFLPPSLRTPKRLNSPGGNVHYERFLLELQDFLLSSECAEKELVYNSFSCKDGTLSEVRLPAAALTVVEGSYSLHPVLQSLYDIKIFCTVSKDEQIARLKKREGESSPKMQAFIDKWIPLETEYFQAFQIEKTADFIIDTEDTQC